MEDICYICYEEESQENLFLKANSCSCSQANKVHTKCFALLKNKITCSICKERYQGIDKLDIRTNDGLRIMIELDNFGFRHEYTVDDQDMKHGVHKIWYHNGNIWEENFYQKGLRNGVQKLYSVNGDLYREILYDHGNRV